MQSGLSTATRFSFRMFTFTDADSIYLHCRMHLCLLSEGNCDAHCYPGHHNRVRRELLLEASGISLGPLKTRSRRQVLKSNASSHFSPLTMLLVATMLAVKTLM
ncbi:uromodulin-like [Synchiropus splendidus]|uniref:uromodulin-like n=1 Tax=Synchiropus splendidus TaxID=270530 RepID=UPI00237DD419|nr:uromodulin-like [Synchiropus splendidus]